jgi:phosphoribosylformylglycinamidine cyclo-ligase
VLEGIVEGCKAARCALLGGETAEMPDMYPPHEYDLAGFAVGVVSKDQLLDGSRVKAGDVILGLESSGPHSNGFSLIRKLINLEKKNQQEQGLIDFCMTPTRIYVDAFFAFTKRTWTSIKGLGAYYRKWVFKYPTYQ